jgi:glucose/arabinose dehydrogenase
MMKRTFLASLTAAAAAIITAAVVRGVAPAPACDPDNGGIKLPDGFCALVVADNVGPARHLTVAPNGDLFVALEDSRGKPGGIVALHDKDGDGKMDATERFGTEGGTGITIRKDYLYFATTTSVVRYKMRAGELKPAGAPEVIVGDLPKQQEHADKTFAFDDKGAMFVNVGAPSNECQPQDRRPKVPGQDPCPLLEKHGGIWRFDENRAGQKQDDGKRYATGFRQMVGLAWHDGALYAAMNGRDQLDTLWPDQFTAADNAERPSELLMQVKEGSNFGWPYCYHDFQQNKYLLAPEYGGDGKKTARCESFTPPTAAFPAHWAPVDLMFYTGTQFPKRYQGGAFVAFHGSWNRAPQQAGYNVTFQAVSAGKASAKYEVFADGFIGKPSIARSNEAMYRPDGVAQGPDGSLYVAESQKGRIWRVMYKPK